MHTLLRTLKAHFALHGRTHLPWRGSRNPYRILVSEVMLQQTQVDRAAPYYTRFLTTFPTARALARAPLRKVLMAWQGLGYNRRAKYLQAAAKTIMKEHKGKFPRTVEDIEALPGVGPYTARAVAAFAFNKPEVFIETNIRTVFIHHFFHSNVLQNVRTKKVSDAELLPLIEKALKKSGMQPRDFYAALMDYGSDLKRRGVKLNARSKHYAKQKKFEGSARQLRGAILRELLRHRATAAVLGTRIPRSPEELKHELARLAAEGLITLQGRYFSISK